MPRTLEEIDAALEDAERKIAKQGREIKALENAESAFTGKLVDLSAEITKLKRMIRSSRREVPPVSEEDAKRGVKGRTEKVLVNGKVVVRARKAG